MKRPLLAAGISYGLATWASFFFAAPLILSAVCTVLGLIAFLLKKGGLRLPLILLSAAIAFAASEMYYQRSVLPLREAQGMEVVVQGMVTSVDVRRLPSYTLTVRASFPEDSLPDTTLRIRGWGEMLYAPGDGIRAVVQLEELRGSQASHNARGVFVGARFLEAESFDELALFDQLESFFLRRRSLALANLTQNISPQNVGMLAGMTLGELADMDPALSNALRRSGLIHIVVVSGMHLSVLVGALHKLLARLKVNRQLSGLIAALGALCFGIMVGFSPAISRALIMLLVFITAEMLSRKSDSLTSLGLSLLLICVVSPHWVLDRGMWMSFTATAGIIKYSGPIGEWLRARLLHEGRVAKPVLGLFIESVSLTMSALVFSLPVTILTVGWVSLISPVVNLLITPLVVPAILFGLISTVLTGGLAAPFALIADVCISLISGIAHLASALPFAIFPLDRFWMLIWLALVGGTIIYLVRKKAGKELWRYAITLVALAFALGSITSAVQNRGQIEVVVIEETAPVILLREGSAVIVGTPTLFELGRLTRYLDYRGVRRLDAIIAYDSGDQITSALIRLVENYGHPLIITPDDEYISRQIMRAIPGAQVHMGGENVIDVLGGVAVRHCSATRRVEIRVGHVTIMKSGQEYGILLAEHGAVGQLAPNTVQVWADGVMLWHEDIPPTFEPLGALIFGERRLVVSIQ